MTLPPQNEAADPAIALRDAAAANPELQRLLAERDLLMQRMEEIAARSPGSFAGHDTVRFPVEPLGERRTRDARWAQARDESRSAAVQRIVEARRREAATKLDQWPEARERQRIEAASDAQAERQTAEAQARALDARIERARQDLLAERWTARTPETGDDWHRLREQQASEALAEARARAAEAAAREQALERRIARDRLRRPDDWSEERDRARVRALELARRQTAEDAAIEQALDLRLARAREDRLRENRAAQNPERAPQWVPPSERRDPASRPAADPPRPLPPTAAERSLDDRIARAREPAPRAARPARDDRPDPEPAREARRKPDPEPAASAPRPSPPRAEKVRAAPVPAAPPVPPEKRAPAAPPRPSARARQPEAESFEQRRDRLRAARTEARRRENRAMRIGEAVAAGVERAAGAVRKLDSSLGRVGRALREAGADDETLRRVERARDASAGLASGAERAERAAGLGRGALRVWQERRDRIARAARKPDDLGGGRKAAGRRLDMSIGSVDELTALRDKARALWPEKKKEKEEKPKPPKTSAEKLEDLDKRREQALERLKGRREDERRRALSRDRLAAMADRFGSLGG